MRGEEHLVHLVPRIRNNSKRMYRVAVKSLEMAEVEVTADIAIYPLEHARAPHIHLISVARLVPKLRQSSCLVVDSVPFRSFDNGVAIFTRFVAEGEEVVRARVVLADKKSNVPLRELHDRF